MSILARSEAVEAQLEQPVAPARVRALYDGLALARTVTRNPRLGDALWQRRGRPQLPRLDPQDDIEVPRVRREDLSPEVLREVTRCPTPVVLEGLVADSEAVKQWTPEFFRANYGDVVVPMPTRIEGRNHMKVAEIIDRFRDGGDFVPQVNNVTDIILQTPELRNALPFELIHDWTGERLHGAQLFVAAKDSGTSYHCANEFNFYMMINGEKDWYLVHPRHSMWLDPVLDARSGIYAAAKFQRTDDWEERPEGVPMLHAHLRPGDVLLNHPWWWHLVKNRSDSVAVSTRWLRWRFRFGTQNPLFSTLQWLVPHQWSIVWKDYVRGGQSTDAAWLETFSTHHKDLGSD